MTTITLDHLDCNHQELAMKSLDWMEQYWQEKQCLLRPDMPRPWGADTDSIWYDVRGTVRYAIGLLLRAQNGDVDRAQTAIRGVLANQIIKPGHVAHGTFARSPEERQQPDQPRIWIDYDPNWREFIGCSLALIIKHFSEKIDDNLLSDIVRSLKYVVEGSVDRRVSPHYTNIALMSAFICDFVGAYCNQREWSKYGEELALAIYEIYQKTEAFEEYNSPTYYGVDFVALAFWRSCASSNVMRTLGSEMEEGLWRDVGKFYHAGMKNMSGPYVRSYGMDMQEYLASVTLWIWAGIGERFAPRPDLVSGGHLHDFTVGPTIALLGSKIPKNVQSVLQSFPGERLIERKITDDPTIITSWQSEGCMLGGIYGKTYVAPQLHAATAHWLSQSGALHYFRFLMKQDDELLRTQDARIHASAARRHLSIATQQFESSGRFLDGVFEVHAPGLDPSCIQADKWDLPNFPIMVKTSMPDPVVTTTPSGLEIRYKQRSDSALAVMNFELHCVEPIT